MNIDEITNNFNKILYACDINYLKSYNRAKTNYKKY